MKRLQIVFLAIAIMAAVSADRWSFPEGPVREAYAARGRLLDGLSKRANLDEMRSIAGDVALAEKQLEVERMVARRLVWLSLAATVGALACSLFARKESKRTAEQTASRHV